MLSANFVVVVFLALKNTPLAVLTAYSYERLNVIHQVAGYATILYLVLHACVYSGFFGEAHKLYILREEEQICGIIAGFGFLGVFISAAFIRRYWYEAFYITHIISFLVALICGAFHQPDLGKGILVMLLIIACIWVSDRLIRAARVLYYSTNNHATVHPLPHGGTKIVMAKKPWNAVPGKHCFVWIPKIRLMEMHPFTVVATEPMEFIINSYDGFTGDLHKYALEHPGASLKASIDGPYGTFPDPMEYDKIILIAGGSGASFTFGLAVNLLERMGPESTKNIVFIWAVKKHGKPVTLYDHILRINPNQTPHILDRLLISLLLDNLTWFTDHLTTLRTHNHSPKVTVSLFVTRAPASPMSDEQRRGSVLVRGAIHRTDEESLSSEHQVSPISPIRDLEKALMELPPRAHARDDDKQHIEETEEKRNIQETHADHDGGHEHEDDHAPRRRNHFRPANSAISTATSNDSLALAHRVTPGRPDTAMLIREEVSRTPGHHRVLISACGPNGLMRVVRKTAAGCIRGDGPEVELHCEQFGW